MAASLADSAVITVRVTPTGDEAEAIGVEAAVACGLTLLNDAREAHLTQGYTDSLRCTLLLGSEVVWHGGREALYEVHYRKER
jgi:hypothetical protein